MIIINDIIYNLLVLFSHYYGKNEVLSGIIFR